MQAKVVELAAHPSANDDNKSNTVLRTFELQSDDGFCRVQVCNVGASILRFYVTSLDASSKASTLSPSYDDIVLGYKDASHMHASESNQKSNPYYFGVIVGRVANRIERGLFHLNDTDYRLDINDPPHNHLHGGNQGFSHQIWDVVETGTISNKITTSPNKNALLHIPYVTFGLDSPDGDQGYPGHVYITATYSLRPSLKSGGSAVLRLEMNANLVTEPGQSNVETPINLSQHSYFNLAPSISARSEGILNHSLKVDADSYTPVDPSTSIPSRDIRSLENKNGNYDDEDTNSMDISYTRKIRDVLYRIGCERPEYSLTEVESHLTDRSTNQSHATYGLDHNYCIRSQPWVPLPRVATLSYRSRRRLTIHASTPGVQVYTGNYLGAEFDGNRVENSIDGMKDSYQRWSGICFETQHFPNSLPQHPNMKQDSLNETWKCPILTSKDPTYQHIVEYTIEQEMCKEGDENDETSLLSLGTRSGDSNTNTNTANETFSSIDDMWNNQTFDTWYRQSLDFYEDNCPPTVDGVLGGIGWVSDCDLAGSRRFLESLDVSKELLQDGTACECGAGIGRVTKGLLLDVCNRCDVVESCSALLSAAPDYIGDESYRCRFFCTELQNWKPQAKKYALIWIQWTAIYLTDADFVSFLQRCLEALVPGGVIVLKENTCADETSFVVDDEDASLTRSLSYWHQLIFQSSSSSKIGGSNTTTTTTTNNKGLRIIQETFQDDFPDDIFPVPMIAIQSI